MSYYRHQLFFCTNVRPEGAARPSCGRCGSARLRGYFKARLKALGLAGAGQVRANTSSCHDRCEEGPCVVVYPEGVWYTFIDEEDLEEIIQSHIINGQPVERLRLPNRPPE